MSFLASLSHLVICNFWSFWGCFGGKYSGLGFFLFFYLISLKLESGLSSSHLYVPFIIVQQM